MKHWYNLRQTQDLIAQKPCDGQWVLFCEAQHLGDGIQERAPGPCGDGHLFLRRAVSLLCTKDGAGGEPHTSPVHCPQQTPPDKMAPTDRTGPPHLQTLAGIIIMQPRAQSTGGISCTVVPGWGLFYAASWRADLVSGMWCGAGLFFWALTCLVHLNKWRVLVWKFAATLR